jgi:exopolyphosphatase/guanosine-5'-triphosphate,3'-diphosphate pyrophosphatase
METIPRTTSPQQEGIQPLRVATVEVGTNAIRFLAAEFPEPARYRILEESRIPVRLGHGVFSTGRINEEAAGMAVEGIVLMSERMKALGVQRSRAVATCAVRESRNKRYFVRRVRDATGLVLEIVSGAEEARLVHAAVRTRVALDGDPWMFAELGGGSVEIFMGNADSISWCETHAMGAVRLLELFSQAGKEPAHFERLLAEYTETIRLPERILHAKIHGFVATGGNIETLAKLAGTEPNEKGVRRMATEKLANLIAKLAPLSVADRARLYGLRPDRADVILPAAIVYCRLAGLAKVDEIVVPGVGVREGILLDLANGALAAGGAMENRIRSDTLALGRKFAFEEAHALTVAALSLSLFDQLAPWHGMGGNERKILQAAAMLHDIGGFVSYKGHHKHSLYLIAQSELPGFTPREMFVVANVARYHRKGPPSLRHKGFALLPPQERDRVRRLSAILRVADALDREHRGRMGRVVARVEGNSVEIHAEGRGDLLLERWALKKKSRFFQEVFGKRIALQTGGEGP